MENQSGKVLSKENLTLIGQMYLTHRKAIFISFHKKVKDVDIAQDLTSEVFIKVINFVFSGRYVDQSKHNRWLKKIAKNVYVDYVRKNSKYRVLRHLPGMSDPVERISDKHVAQGGYKIDADALLQIRSWLDLLHPDQKDIVLRRLHGDKFEVIAKDLDISVNTATGRMRCAIKNLRKIVVRHDIDIHDFKSG